MLGSESGFVRFDIPMAAQDLRFVAYEGRIIIEVIV